MEREYISIPVRARIEVSDGVATMTDAEYKDIPADAIAKFIYDRLGGRIPEVKTKESEDKQ